MQTSRRAPLAALTLLLCAGSAFAQDAALSYVSGDVKIEAAGRETQAQKGAALASGDAVATGEKSAAVVTLPDGSKLKLRGNTRVVVTLPGKASPTTSVFLSAGGVFATVAKQVKKHFEVRTQSAVAAVRGTEFFTAFGRGRDLWICVNKGVVEVGTDASKRTSELHAGQGVLIKGGADLTKPQKYEWTRKLNWNMDPAGGAVEDKTNLDAAYSDLLDQDYR